MKSRLFSDDGIDASHARREPDSIYFPDENTQSEIKLLFTTLKSTQNESENGVSVNISELPFSADLAMLAQGNLLSIDDVINGMCCVATHFMSQNQLIQARVNAYLRCKLAAAEVMLNGMVSCQSEQALEKDQILLSSVTVPSSPRADYSGFRTVGVDGEPGRLSRVSSQRQLPLGADQVANSQAPTLFRSKSVLQDHLQTYASQIVTLDDKTLSTALNFLPGMFLPTGFLSRKGLSSYDADKLAELFEFFDFDDDGIVTKDDVLLGISNIAKFYIAMDEFTQLMANSYVQRKVRRAISAIDVIQKSKAMSPSPSKQSIEVGGKDKLTYTPGTTIVYSDEEGNNHVAKVIRASQRKMAGDDAYYIETKGLKLFVSINRLRSLDPQDRAMLERQDPYSQRTKQQQQQHTHLNLELQQAVDGSGQQKIRSNHTSDVGTHDDIPPQTHSTRSMASPAVQPVDTPGKGGILGYLKSSIGILGIGGTKSAPVVPTTNDPSDGVGEAEGMVTRCPSILADQADADSVLESIDDRIFHTDAVVVVSGSRASQLQPVSAQLSALSVELGNSSDTLDRLAPGEVPSAENVTVLPEGSLDQDDSAALGTPLDISQTSAVSVSASQRLKMSTALLAMDSAVLFRVGKATGPSFKLMRNAVPKPKKVEPYPIYFNRGKNGFFEFNQVDFGVQFIPFLRDIVPSGDPLWQSHADSLAETNRCFFLHFGVAMGLHPFALQQCFRSAAAELLKFPENEMTIFFGEALESLLLRNDFVDAQVLSAIWPLEFDRYKVLVVRVDHNGRIESFTSFRSEAGPVDENGDWNGDELIFTLQWNHFTILKPKSDQLSRPITAVLAAASMIGIMPLEFVTKVDSDVTKRFKIC